MNTHHQQRWKAKASWQREKLVRPASPGSWKHTHKTFYSSRKFEGFQAEKNYCQPLKFILFFVDIIAKNKKLSSPRPLFFIFCYFCRAANSCRKQQLISLFVAASQCESCTHSSREIVVVFADKQHILARCSPALPASHPLFYINNSNQMPRDFALPY